MRFFMAISKSDLPNQWWQTCENYPFYLEKLKSACDKWICWWQIMFILVH